MYREVVATQKFPDFIGGSGVTKAEYWLDDKGSEKIRFIVEENDIIYVKSDEKGYITDWQTLYRGNNVVNLEQYKAQMIDTYMIYNDIDASGDVNCDGDLRISDIVMFQKWLLGASDAELVNWKAADFCKDIIENPKVKNMLNGDKEYTMEIKQLSSSDVFFLNSLLFYLCKKSFAFANKSGIEQSLEYIQKENNIDLSFVC